MISESDRCELGRGFEVFEGWRRAGMFLKKKKLIAKWLKLFRSEPAYVTPTVQSLGWVGTCWLLEVDEPDEFTKQSLPRLINGLTASFRTYIQSSAHGVHRSKIPSSSQIDNTNYLPLLHAGMLLSDGERFTTSGVPIEQLNDPDSRYFTIASHGFVHGAEVYHPAAPPLGRKIGIADIKFGETDICL